MALIPCPECGKKVSNQAESCPGCGYPIHKYIEEQQSTSTTDVEVSKPTDTNVHCVQDTANTHKEKKHLSKKAIILIVIASIIVLAALTTVYIFVFKQPFDAAMILFDDSQEQYVLAADAYEIRIAEAVAKNDEFDSHINDLHDLVYSGDTPCDETALNAALDEIATAQSVREDICTVLFEDGGSHDFSFSVFQAKAVLEAVDKIKQDTQAIIAETEKVNIPDYTSEIKKLDSAKVELEKSILQNKQVTNPSEEFVIERISGVDGILSVEAATEDNDPNGQLHKSGGYTSAVFFIYEGVTDWYVLSYKGSTPVERGTDGGGCIEVYATSEDAEKRNTYLASFDGTAISSGSHTVCGTMVVRTSDSLNATQQQTLEDMLVSTLIELK